MNQNCRIKEALMLNIHNQPMMTPELFNEYQFADKLQL